MGLWILIFAYIFFANYLVEAYESGKYSPRAFWILAWTYLAIPFPLMLLVVWWIVSKVRDNVIALRATRVVVIAIFLATVYIAYYINFYEPGIYIYGKTTPWVQAQDWARDNTPKDAKFITPPEIWSIQKSDWRVHSQRASVVTLSEILMAAFQPGYETEWTARFEDVAPGALAQFKGNYFNNVQFTRQAYNGLSEETLLSLACKYDANYVVMEKAANKNLPVVYQNSVYAVYDVDCEK